MASPYLFISIISFLFYYKFLNLLFMKEILPLDHPIRYISKIKKTTTTTKWLTFPCCKDLCDFLIHFVKKKCNYNYIPVPFVVTLAATFSTIMCIYLECISWCKLLLSGTRQMWVIPNSSGVTNNLLPLYNYCCPLN